MARALSGGSDVSDETRARVLRAVEQSGYERNHLAVGMRSGRSGLLGLVIPDIANPFWAEVARGAQDQAAEQGASLLVFSSDWDSEREARHLKALSQVRVEGAIVNPVSDKVDSFHRFRLPFVLIGSSAERFPGHASVGSDIAQGVRLGMDHLLSKGHPAPALILGPKGRLARARFLRAVHDHRLEHDLDPSVLTTEDCDYTVEGGYAAMQRLMQRGQSGHLAVFAANDLMALGAMMAVRDAGLSCPDDVSILGFDGVPATAFSWPGLTTIEKPARELGYRATATLVADIAGGGSDDRTYLPCRLIERGSVRDLSPSKARRTRVEAMA